MDGMLVHRRATPALNSLVPWRDEAERKPQINYLFIFVLSFSIKSKAYILTLASIAQTHVKIIFSESQGISDYTYNSVEFMRDAQNRPNYRLCSLSFQSG